MILLLFTGFHNNTNNSNSKTTTTTTNNNNTITILMIIMIIMMIILIMIINMIIVVRIMIVILVLLLLLLIIIIIVIVIVITIGSGQTGFSQNGHKAPTCRQMLLYPHVSAKVHEGELQHFCDDPVCPNPVRKPSINVQTHALRTSSWRLLFQFRLVLRFKSVVCADSKQMYRCVDLYFRPPFA